MCLVYSNRNERDGSMLTESENFTKFYLLILNSIWTIYVFWIYTVRNRINEIALFIRELNILVSILTNDFDTIFSYKYNSKNVLEKREYIVITYTMKKGVFI